MGEGLDFSSKVFMYCSISLGQWSRWGRGSCEGYSLRIGGGSFVSFEASVTRGVRRDDGSYPWRSDINGKCEKSHATMEEAMARFEHELVFAAAPSWRDSKRSKSIGARTATREPWPRNRDYEFGD